MHKVSASKFRQNKHHKYKWPVINMGESASLWLMTSSAIISPSPNPNLLTAALTTVPA